MPTPIARLQTLRRTKAFGGLSDTDLNVVACCFKQVGYERGDVLFNKGDPACYSLVVHSGRVAVSVLAENGRSALIDVIGPSRLIGSVAVFSETPSNRPFHVTALTETVALRVERDDLRDLCQRLPSLAMGMLSHLAAAICAMSEDIEGLVFMDTPTRLARCLVQFGEMGGRSAPEGVLLEDIRSQEQLGQMLALSREVVNKALKSLEHTGIITVRRGRIYVVDMAALKSMTMV
ncbi:Transcriptional regulator, Crp/Fnr family [Azospirillum argentinense]|uniref:Crp/Fnr family transcriptional regulator n=1 Tax=Azospirillum argentinense TaxID=2970906 RepID=UPI0032DEF918